MNNLIKRKIQTFPNFLILKEKRNNILYKGFKII